MNETQGIITDILSFSVNDGPGIRTTVFFKGCPLRCVWCHNPETWRRAPQCMFNAALCVHCGACAACPAGARDAQGSWQPQQCRGCGWCAQVCPTGASRLCGRKVTAADVVKAVLPDRPFFRQTGGVTLSGGEPLFQPAFALALAGAFREAGVHVLLETCGYAPYADYAALLPYVDGFLFDWKETDPEKHRRFTGVENHLILENLTRLSAAGAQITLRCPIIPGYNDTPAHFSGIGRLTHTLPGIRQVDLLPYHALGNSKRLQLGEMADRIAPPSQETIQAWQRALQALCAVPVCR